MDIKLNITQQRIYNYLSALINKNNIPVMISQHNIAVTLKLSDITVKRNLDMLIYNNIIYRAKLNNNTIYYTKPIDMSKDFVCYVRNQVCK